MDSEFLALSVVFILIGITGIVLFSGPMTPSGDSCNCPIPSPEPGAAQGTSSIFLALGILFLPMGLMKGGLPSFRRVATAPSPRMSSSAYTPLPLSSGSIFAFGILLVILGIDAVLIPGFLVFKSTPITVGGAVLATLGLLAAYFGSKKPNPD